MRPDQPRKESGGGEHEVGGQRDLDPLAGLRGGLQLVAAERKPGTETNGAGHVADAQGRILVRQAEGRQPSDAACERHARGEPRIDRGNQRGRARRVARRAGPRRREDIDARAGHELDARSHAPDHVGVHARGQVGGRRVGARGNDRLVRVRRRSA